MADIRMTMVGSYESILKALASGKLKPDNYVYVKDKEILAWVNEKGELHLLGDSVQQVSELPEKGSKNALYVKGTSLYVWTGAGYASILGELFDRLEVVEGKLADMVNPETGEPVKVTEYVEESIAPVQDQVQEVSTDVESIKSEGAAFMIHSLGGLM